MAGIQTPDVPGAFDVLELDDLSVDAGSIDPQTISAVYPVESAWISQSPIICSLGSQTLGAWRTWLDTTTTASASPTTVPLVNQNRWYTSITVSITGGSVDPIAYQLSLQVGAANWPISRFDQPNPSRGYIHGIWIPAGYTLAITNSDSGAGATMTVELMGLQAPRGSALPLFPTPTYSSVPY